MFKALLVAKHMSAHKNPKYSDLTSQQKFIARFAAYNTSLIKFQSSSTGFQIKAKAWEEATLTVKQKSQLRM